ncbi:ABC transporter G family member 25-like [Phoenix dactylifera]|uniref:ABC transporter G family member 25-like n=1 Tax=Phoenix dactylifera TaxID=42345 RepID=A0A8B8J4U4_PHODC|nr:ABC transporter G family member 25-like [Phoenix dactylifera]
MPPTGKECDQNGVANRCMDSFISTSCYPLTLQFMDITYRIKLDPKVAATGSGIKRIFHAGGAANSPAAVPEERTILNGVSGIVSPGEFLAVLGPSGSGKSTLLSVIAGRLQGEHSGAVLANGCRLTKPVLRRTGYVAQDDVLYPHLTVRETLVFSAMLRLPRTVAAAEKVAAADAVVAELGLEKCADTAVGNAFVRGISGGERKRVSIGHEMLVNPSLLVLDEPTSGLDSTAAYRLVATLTGIARKGRSIVTSIHQPSSRVYQMFDSVLLLSEGNCLYFGRGREAMDYFGSVGFAPRFHVNPADFMLDLANGVAQIDYQVDADKSNVKQSLITSYNRVLAPKVKACISAAEAGDVAETGSERSTMREQRNCRNISWFSQFGILLRRSLKERRHETFNSLRVFQVMAAAVLAGSMWWHSNIHDVRDRLGLLFFISIFWGVFASFNAVFTFPQERAIFIKERSAGMYAVSSYFMARMAGDLPMELILPTVFVLVLYWMAGLREEPEAFMMTLAVLLGYVLVAQGLGLALGAAIVDAKKASTAVTVVMLSFLLTGGFYVQNVPSCIAWMKYTSFTFYCYRLLIDVQYRGSELATILSLSHQGNRRETAVEENLGGKAGSAACIVALVAMFVGYRLLAYLALRRIKT